MTIHATERSDPKSHQSANVRFEQLNIRQKRSASSILPIAGLMDYEGEHRVVHRAKVRPAIILDCCPEFPPPEPGQAPWQTHQTMSIIPIYGAPQNDHRAGFPPKAVQAIRRITWPQYIWDKLPIDSATTESIMMLSRVMPIGRHHNYYECLPWVLSDAAMALVDEWLAWLHTGEFVEGSELLLYREMLQEL